MGPRFSPGDRLSVSCWRPTQWSGSKNRQRRVGEGPYMWGLESGQRLFAILFQLSLKTAEIRGFSARSTLVRWGFEGEVSRDGGH